MPGGTVRRNRTFVNSTQATLEMFALEVMSLFSCPVDPQKALLCFHNADPLRTLAP